MYQNDFCIDIMFQVVGKDYAKFWCTLYEGEDYKDLGKWHYYCYQFRYCERGFSTMNCISSSVLTQEHLNACMSIALCGYTIETFPF